MHMHVNYKMASTNFNKIKLAAGVYFKKYINGEQDQKDTS